MGEDQTVASTYTLCKLNVEYTGEPLLLWQACGKRLVSKELDYLSINHLLLLIFNISRQGRVCKTITREEQIKDKSIKIPRVKEMLIVNVLYFREINQN